MYAPHHTAPGKILYRTDEKKAEFVPDLSINLVWYFLFEVGWIRSVGKIVAYMYVGSAGFQIVGRLESDQLVKYIMIWTC